ncbi:ABC transporter ATP-binding protein [Demequina pelophila]|uniref:ABC transporter ATP-binding protein n=1 Tax=Demequina pelophila TaxID=1638984 RepID=UPI000782A3DA|nr:ABC transporter ATP-binding protein [Demequina pelophila]
MVPEVTQKRGWSRFFLLVRRSRAPWLRILVAVGVIYWMTRFSVSATEPASQLLTGDVSVENVTLFIELTLAATLLMLVSGVLTDYLTAVTNRNLRTSLWKHMLRLPLSSFDRTPPTELLSRLTNDVANIGGWLVQTLVTATTIIMAVSMAGQRLMAANLDPILIWVAVAGLPIQWFIGWAFGRLMYVFSRNLTTEGARTTVSLAERLVNIPLIKSFSAMDRETERVNGALDKLYKANTRMGFGITAMTPIKTLGSLAMDLPVLILGISLVGADSMDVQGWVSYWMLSSVIQAAGSPVLSLWVGAKSVQGGTARLGAIFETEIETGGDVAPVTAAPEVAFSDVHFAYGDNPALRGLTHTFRPGTCTAIVGPSGGGKSTLIALAQRLYVPTAGELTVDGVEVSQYRLEEYRRGTGSVPQGATALEGTVRENLLYGLRSTVGDDELSAMMDRVCGPDLLANLPDGLDTVVGDTGVQLSPGQQQHLLLTRMLLEPHPVLLLDEPTASLDPVAAQRAMTAVREVASDATVLIVAHTPAAVAVADAVVVVEEGRVTAAGAVRDLAQTNPYVRSLVEGDHA